MKNFKIYLILVTISFLDVASLAIIFPILNNFEKIYISEWVTQLMLIFIVFFIGLFFIRKKLNEIRYIYFYQYEHKRGEEKFENLFSKKYESIIDQNDGSVAKNIISEAGLIAGGYDIPRLNMIGNLATAILILIALIIYDYEKTLILILFILLIFYFSKKISEKKILTESDNRTAANTERYEILSDIVKNIDEIKVYKIEEKMKEKFLNENQKYVDSMASYTTYSMLPKYLIETSVAVLIILSAYFALKSNETDLLSFAIYAAAAYRLLPAMQNIGADINKMNFFKTAKLIFEDDSKKGDHGDKAPELLSNDVEYIEIFDLTKKFKSKLISYKDLKINKNKFLLIRGSSGKGKSTLLKLITGLILPDTGEINFNKDKKKINTQKKISYSGQVSNFFTGTLRENIKIIDEDIDFSKCNHYIDALEIDFLTGCDDVIEPKRLSGGQKQKLTILKALLLNRDIQIYDESISALDLKSKKLLLSVIAEQKNKIIVFVSHDAIVESYSDVVYNL